MCTQFYSKRDGEKKKHELHNWGFIFFSLKFFFFIVYIELLEYGCLHK